MGYRISPCSYHCVYGILQDLHHNETTIPWSKLTFRFCYFNLRLFSNHKCMTRSFREKALKLIFCRKVVKFEKLLLKWKKNSKWCHHFSVNSLKLPFCSFCSPIRNFYICYIRKLVVEFGSFYARYCKKNLFYRKKN